MTEETTKEAVTAFLVVKDESGFYTALTNLDTKVNVQGVATLQDIKAACFEIIDSINQQTIAAAVVSKLVQLNNPQPEAPVSEPVDEAEVVSEGASVSTEASE